MSGPTPPSGKHVAVKEVQRVFFARSSDPTSSTYITPITIFSKKKKSVTRSPNPTVYTLRLKKTLLALRAMNDIFDDFINNNNNRLRSHVIASENIFAPTIKKM